MSLPSSLKILKNLSIFLAGVLACFLLFVVRESQMNKMVSQENSKNETASHPPNEDKLPTVDFVQSSVPSRTPITEITPSKEALQWLNDSHVQDVRRSAKEDAEMLSEVLSLSLGQRTLIQNKLEQLRLSTEISDSNEYDVIASILTSEQKDKYNTFLEQKRIADAGHFATIRLHSIEGITGPLSELQRDVIFQDLASSLVHGEVVSDSEILKKTLTEKQYLLWSHSSEATPTAIK